MHKKWSAIEHKWKYMQKKNAIKFDKRRWTTEELEKLSQFNEIDE